MDNIKPIASEHHEQAAHHLELAAAKHRDAAKQCLSGNFQKAHDLAISAAEAWSVVVNARLSARDQVGQCGLRLGDVHVEGHRGRIARVKTW